MSGAITANPPPPEEGILDNDGSGYPFVLGRRGVFNDTRVGRSATTATPESTAAPHGGLTPCVTSARKQLEVGRGSPASAAGVTATTRGDTEEEQGEVFASHGVYEEYLAYDCRPPEDNGGEGTSAVAKDGSPTHGVGASATAGGQRQRKKAAATLRLSTPQLALREEIMDSLFDELWDRLTPDLLLIADREGSEVVKPAEPSNKFRDNMEVMS